MHFHGGAVVLVLDELAKLPDAWLGRHENGVDIFVVRFDVVVGGVLKLLIAMVPRLLRPLAIDPLSLEVCEETATVDVVTAWHCLLYDRHGFVEVGKRNHGESAEQVDPLAELLVVEIG